MLDTINFFDSTRHTNYYRLQETYFFYTYHSSFKYHAISNNIYNKFNHYIFSQLKYHDCG